MSFSPVAPPQFVAWLFPFSFDDWLIADQWYFFAFHTILGPQKHQDDNHLGDASATLSSNISYFKENFKNKPNSCLYTEEKCVHIDTVHTRTVA